MRFGREREDAQIAETGECAYKRVEEHQLVSDDSGQDNQHLIEGEQAALAFSRIEAHTSPLRLFGGQHQNLPHLQSQPHLRLSR